MEMYYIENRVQRFNTTFEVKGSKDTNLLLRSVLMPWMKWSAWPALPRSGSPERWSRTSCSPDPPHAHLGQDKYPVFSKNLTQKVWVCFCFCAKKYFSLSNGPRLGGETESASILMKIPGIY